MKIFIIAVFATLTFLSCRQNKNSKEHEVIDQFFTEIKLKSVKLNIPPVLLKPSNICVTDSFMIISQSRRDSMFTIFKIPEMNLLKSFGNRGKGPTEFNSFFDETLEAVNGSSNSFAVANLMTKIQYYKINDILENNFSPYKKVNLPPKLLYFKTITYLSDTSVIGEPYGGKIHLFKFSNNSNKLEKLKNFPEELPLLDKNFFINVFGCTITSKPDNSMIAVAYEHTGEIDIINLKNGTSKRLVYKDFPSLLHNMDLTKTSKNISESPHQKFFCGRIKATNKYFYASVYNEVESKIFLKDGPNRLYIPQIHVFDWNGNPVLKIIVDKFYTMFAVDLENKNLYTLDYDLENEINSYNLIDILK